MERLKNWLGQAPLAGPATTAVAMVGVWYSNIYSLPVESAWPTIAGALALAILVVALLRPLSGSWARAGIISALIAIYVFYFPAILDLLHVPASGVLLAHAAAIALVILIARRIPREAEALRSLVTKCNVLTLLLLILAVIPLGVDLVRLQEPRREAQQSLPAFHGKATDASPDVWHIVLDRYAGADTLQTVYHFDNRPFIEQLRKRGFEVQDQTFSNYQRTAHSISSTLNGSYLDPMTEPMRAGPEDWVPIYRLLRDNAAVRFFEAQGYKTYFAGSWWEPTRFSPVADESIEIRSVPQMARLVFDISAPGSLLSKLDFPYVNGRIDQCHRASEKFRRLQAVAGSGERKYVFAHFLLPHPPFTVNADGSCRPLEQAKAASRSENYLGQVQFANQQVLKLIDAIEAGPRPAIIVIHGDEGPWPAPHFGDEHGLGTDPVDVNWASLPPAKLREKMSTLLAVRSPNGPPTQMPTSPVQIYPTMLREHFGSSDPVPVSRYAVFNSNKQLYRFQDVADRLQLR